MSDLDMKDVRLLDCFKTLDQYYPESKSVLQKMTRQIPFPADTLV